MYASDIGSKMLQWKTFGSELFPTREALEEEIRDIINMSTDPNYSDKDKQCWEDCDEWIDFNELIAPCVEADFEIIEISSDNADSQKN